MRTQSFFQVQKERAKAICRLVSYATRPLTEIISPARTQLYFIVLISLLDLAANLFSKSETISILPSSSLLGTVAPWLFPLTIFYLLVRAFHLICVAHDIYHDILVWAKDQEKLPSVCVAFLIWVAPSCQLHFLDGHPLLTRKRLLRQFLLKRAVHKVECVEAMSADQESFRQYFQETVKNKKNPYYDLPHPATKILERVAGRFEINKKELLPALNSSDRELRLLALRVLSLNRTLP